MTFRRSRFLRFVGFSKDIFNSRVQIFLIVEFQIDDQGVHFRHSNRGLKNSLIVQTLNMLNHVVENNTVVMTYYITYFLLLLLHIILKTSYSIQ